MNQPSDSSLNRRLFLSRSAAALAATSVAGFPMIGRAQAAPKPLKIALVGCGGRGSGAAGQALGADNYVQLAAMGDVFPDRLESALKNLQTAHGGKVDVPDAQKFVGFDAIDKICALKDIDVVLLTHASRLPAGASAEMRGCGKAHLLRKTVRDRCGRREALPRRDRRGEGEEPRAALRLLLPLRRAASASFSSASTPARSATCAQSMATTWAARRG